MKFLDEIKNSNILDGNNDIFIDEVIFKKISNKFVELCYN